MTKYDADNLSELLRRFFEVDIAETMAEDIRQADAVMDNLPSPVLSAEATARVRHRLYRLGQSPSARGRLIHSVLAGIAAGAAAAAMVLWAIAETQKHGPSTLQMPMAHHPTHPVENAAESAVPDRSELPGFTLTLWDDVPPVEEDGAFAEIKSELDNIARWIEAVGIMENSFPNERVLTGETASKTDEKNKLTAFWEG
ncbi:MAG: hypothetical protein GX298_04765 [Planctomycetes bacterium]|nr:hypothetical protein [Planctomycetota bacterium]